MPREKRYIKSTEVNVTSSAETRIKQFRRTLGEHGFWDYTTPITGGMERYTQDDYSQLFEDMAKAEMNSIVICPKWMTTGYRSKLPYIDQMPDNPVIASDNQLLRFAITQAKKHGIKVWFLLVVNHFDADKFGGQPVSVSDNIMGYKFPFRMGVYNCDNPLVQERAVEICEEIVELFPDIDGLVIELEHDMLEMPQRIPLYNKWAEKNKRRPFKEVGHPLNPRLPDIADWRDYGTESRIAIMKMIEKAVHAKGFKGDFTMLAGLGNSPYNAACEVNFEIMAKQIPHFSAVIYEYNYDHNRFTSKDIGILAPKYYGINTFYLPRGIMTWDMSYLNRLPLDRHWQMDIDDLPIFKPDGVWWFGSGTVSDGVHVSLTDLKKLGYKDGTDARRALLEKLKAWKTT